MKAEGAPIHTLVAPWPRLSPQTAWHSVVTTPSHRAKVKWPGGGEADPQRLAQGPMQQGQPRRPQKM